MKRLSTILSLLVLLSVSAMAQVKIGYFSYDEALKSMAQYPTIERDMSQLRAQYDAEMQRVENEFNAKYEEFLEGYSTYATSIRQKRQSELKTMMEHNISFKEESQRLLSQAEADAITPLKEHLDATIQRIAQKYGYAIILNTDSNACPYIDASLGENITDLIKEALK